MGLDFVPTVDPDFSTWEQYFEDYDRQRTIWLAEKGGFDTVQDEDGTVQVVEREKVSRERGYRIIEPYARADLRALGRSPKALAVALESMGWTLSIWRQVGEHERVLYVSDSKEGDANQHSAGDVRYPAKVVRRYCVEARFGEHPVAIQAFFEGDGDEGTSASFQNCRIRDSAYGIMTVDTLDYTRTKRDAQDRGWSEERRIQEGAAMNARYPAEHHKVHTIYYFAADPMNQWVDFYLDATRSDAKRLTRKKAEPKTESAAERESKIIAGGEWSG
jgi:hypothetical protein